MNKVHVTYYSDVLCIWAHVAQARVEAIKDTFRDEVEIDYRFMSVFGDAIGKLEGTWKDREGFSGYAHHVQTIAGRFPHVKVHPEVWKVVRPVSSLGPHAFLKALMSWERDTSPSASPLRLPVFESVTRAFRRGFFEDGHDISDWATQCAIATPYGVPIAEVERRIRDGSALAQLSADYADAEKNRIEGSPTFALNAGRQKLFGNVGFRVIDANIRELLRDPVADQASWC